MNSRTDAPNSGRRLSNEALAFAPGLLAIQERPPAPLAKVILWALAILVAILLVWACFGKLDIIVSAPGRLVPANYLKIVQPSEPGIVREILVHEGERVSAGQVLLRMDRQESDADSAAVANALKVREMQLRRIDAELADRPLARKAGDVNDAFRQVQTQFEVHQQAYRESVAQAEEALRRAEHDRQAGEQTLEKLKLTNPIFRSQANTYADLGKDGYVPKTAMEDKQREFIENDQELKAQGARVDSLSASVDEAQRQLNELKAKARSDLQNERIEADADRAKLQQDMAKQSHKAGLLELKATEAGVVKDLSTHTIGTVVTAGTVLMSIVPEKEPVVAEVMVPNEDVGFVHAHQAVKVKVASYAFQKYGMLDGRVRQVWPDATEPSTAQAGANATSDNQDAAREGASGGFKALVDLGSQKLVSDTHELALMPGMRVTVEINQGRRTVMEYLLSPIMKVAQEGARER